MVLMQMVGVVNFLTYKNFDGFKIKFGDQSAENNNNKEANFGLLFGAKFLGSMLSLVSTN